MLSGKLKHGASLVTLSMAFAGTMIMSQMDRVFKWAELSDTEIHAYAMAQPTGISFLTLSKICRRRILRRGQFGTADGARILSNVDAQIANFHFNNVASHRVSHDMGLGIAAVYGRIFGGIALSTFRRERKGAVDAAPQS